MIIHDGDCPYPKPGSTSTYDSEDCHGKAIDANEESHPGIHERLHDFFMATYPGEPVEAEEFFDSENS